MARRLYLVVLVGCIALSGGLAGPAQSAQSCGDGRFYTDARLPFPGAAETPLAIGIEADQLVLAPFCPPAAAKMRRTRRGLAARARWSACESIGTGIHLVLRSVSSDCSEVRGLIIVNEPPAEVRFTATRIDRCDFAIECPRGTLPDDTDGDGCNDVCLCQEVRCPASSDAVDTNGDGCEDACDPPISRCRRNSDCPDDTLYCSRDSGRCRGPGVCRPRAEFCTRQWDPVCGCDGRTYSNTCGAASAAVNVTHDRACFRRR